MVPEQEYIQLERWFLGGKLHRDAHCSLLRVPADDGDGRSLCRFYGSRLWRLQGCMKRASWLGDEKDPERHTAINGQSFQLRAPGRPDTTCPARDKATLHDSPVLTETLMAICNLTRHHRFSRKGLTVIFG